MDATITQRPQTFDRVDRIKEALGEEPREGDDRVWILGGPLSVRVDGADIVVPRGFTTDGASIPRFGQVLTGWDPWEPPQQWAAIVHDWLYCQPLIAKRYSDEAFKAVLIAERANWWQTQIMYLAVRYAGGPAYNKDQEFGPQIYV